MSDMLVRDNLRDASNIARQIVVLLDGAATVMLIHRDPAYVEAAGEVAAALVEDARPRRTATRRGIS